MEAPRLHISFAPPVAVIQRLEKGGIVVAHPERGANLSRKGLLDAVAGCDAVITLLSDRVDEKFLDAAGSDLRIVANYAVGYDNIDLQAARRRGIVVSNTPGVLDEATADLTFALLLAASRRVVEADRFMRRGSEWSWHPDLFTGLDVSAGATLGIVGLGRIGLAVARRAQAFGMTVVATPSRSSADEARALGIESLPLEHLLERSDAVTLHCPLTSDTHHLIGARELARIGPQGVLINTARGPIVDEVALVQALRTGTIAAAGLDVYEEEPSLTPGLRNLDNVVLLPHIGSAGAATRLRMLELAVANVLDVMSGSKARTAVLS